MTNQIDIADGILAEPAQPGSFRICPDCRSRFALEHIASRASKLQGSIDTYQCRKCDERFEFSEYHPPDAI